MVLYHQTIMGSQLGSNHELLLTSAGKIVEQGHDGSRKPPHTPAPSLKLHRKWGRETGSPTTRRPSAAEERLNGERWWR